VVLVVLVVLLLPHWQTIQGWVRVAVVGVGCLVMMVVVVVVIMRRRRRRKKRRARHVIDRAMWVGRPVWYWDDGRADCGTKHPQKQ